MGTQRDLSNEYQHYRVWMVFKNLCVLVLWTKVASALEGLKLLRYVTISILQRYDILMIFFMILSAARELILIFI